jgi:hypothetical protein
MPPNPETGFVALLEVVTGELAGAKFHFSTNTPTSSSDPLPTRTRHPRRLPCASRLLSHRIWSPHPVGAPRVVLATSVGPARRLPLHAGSARSSYPSTTRTPTPPPAALRTPTPSPASTQTPRTSSTSGQTLRIPSPKTTLLSNPYQGRLPGWL